MSFRAEGQASPVERRSAKIGTIVPAEEPQQPRYGDSEGKAALARPSAETKCALGGFHGPSRRIGIGVRKADKEVKKAFDIDFVLTGQYQTPALTFDETYRPSAVPVHLFPSATTSW